MARLAGKQALVTGAARGSGAAIATLFAAEGASVVLVDILDDRGAALASELGRAASFVHLDVTSEAGWEAVAERARAPRRAGQQRRGPAPRHDRRDRDRRVRACDAGQRARAVPGHPRRACRCCAASGAGAIVNIGSIDSVQGAALTGAYTASKFALRGLTKVVALENRKRGVRANIVCPMLGNPEMHPEIVGDALGPDAPRRSARRRISTSIAEAACYFAVGRVAVLHRDRARARRRVTAPACALDLPDAWFDPDAARRGEFT